MAAISETWLRPGSRFRIPGFSCLREDRDDGRAGCAILIKRGYPFVDIPLPPHSREINAVAAKVMGINFVSIYIPHPNINLIPDLSTILFSIPPPLLIMGDFNSHNTAWGSTHTDVFSAFLLELFDDVNVSVINDGSPTHRVYPNQNPNSVLDLSACSPNLSCLLSYQVLRESFGSDHFPIIISQPSTVQPSPAPQPLLKYKLDKADWPNFSVYVERKLKEIDSNIFPPLELYLHFQSVLIKAADEHIPKKKVANSKVPSPPWWNAECTAAIKERRDAERRYNSTGFCDDFIAYQKISARTKRLLKKRKKEAWKAFCESLNPRTPPSLVWKNIKKFRGSLESDRPDSHNPPSWLTEFADKLAPPSVPAESCISQSPPSTRLGPLDNPFTYAELELALDGLRNSSPGEDGIPYIFIRKLSRFSREHLLRMYNLFFASGDVPEAWKTQIVIPILKPSKNPQEANSYRPIALSATIGKIFEHLLKNRLEWFAENKNLIANTQFGFRKGKSTMDSLCILTSDIRLALSKKHHVVGCFLDVSAAYDNVLLPVLRAKMLQLSIPVRIVHFICRLFLGRSIKIRTGNSFHPTLTLWQGLPQGSVLSPLLYNLYTCDIEQSVSPFCSMLQYADDLVLYTATQSFADASKNLNEALSYLKVWLDDHGLSLSPHKSCTVIFSRNRLIPNININYDHEIIHCKNSVKFLGIYLDSKMTGVPHLEYTAGKCEKSLNVLRSLSGVWWGAHPYCQKLVYNATVRSQMDYGSLVIEPCNKNALKKLDLIQAKGLRIALGAMKSSPKNAMQVECLDPPLSLRRQYLADRFLFKTCSVSNHPLLPRLDALSQEVSENTYWTHKETPRYITSYSKIKNLLSPLHTTNRNPIFEASYESLIYTPKVILDLGIDKDSPVANSLFNKKTEKWQDRLHFFTDASKTDSNGYVGSAVWIPKYKIALTQKGPAQSSVFTGESIAILEAIKFSESHSIPKIAIFSDAKSCLQAIVGNHFKMKSKSPIILEIKEALLRCEKKGLEITLAWIPSHCGILGNEKADMFAKQAITIGSQDYKTILPSDLIMSARTDLRKSWQSAWDLSRLQKGRHYGLIQPLIPRRPWFFNFRSADKWVTSTICRLRLGHVCTPVFLAKIRVRDSSLCECGLDEGTLDHIFFNCGSHTFSLYDVLPDDIPRPINFLSILSRPDPPLLKILIKYIKYHKIKL